MDDQAFYVVGRIAKQDGYFSDDLGPRIRICRARQPRQSGLKDLLSVQGADLPKCVSGRVEPCERDGLEMVAQPPVCDRGLEVTD